VTFRDKIKKKLKESMFLIRKYCFEVKKLKNACKMMIIAYYIVFLVLFVCVLFLVVYRCDIM